MTAAQPSPLVELVLRHLQVKTNVCSFQKHEHGYTLEHRTVPDYNLIFCTRGKPVWVIDGTEFPLSPGQLLLVPPGVHHHGYSLTQRITLGSIHVEATLSGGQDVFDLLRPPIAHRFTERTPLDAYLRGALAEWQRPSQADAHLMLRSWARLIVIELLRQSASLGQLQPREIDPVIADVLRHLTDRLAEPISLDELAAFVGYTPQHLNRLFRQTLGVTPLQYHARLRMDRAAELLAEGALTVKAVAERVGIDDPYYFSRLFKQHFRRSPAQYRQAALEAGRRE